MRYRLRLWWKRRQQVNKLKSLEVYFFNYGPPWKWIAVRDENTRLGVWNGTYKLEDEDDDRS